MILSQHNILPEFLLEAAPVHGQVAPPSDPRSFLRAVDRLQRRNKSTVFILAPDERFPVPIHSCTSQEAEYTLSTLTKVDRIDLVLESSGGDPHSAYKIAILLRNRCSQLVIYVPHSAKSAATLISLVADRILMSETAELGPLDTQVADPRDSTNSLSALDGFKALEALSTNALRQLDECAVLMQKQLDCTAKEAYGLATQFVSPIARALYERVDPLDLGHFKQALELAWEYGLRLLERSRSMSPKLARHCLDHLVYEYPSHSFVLDYIEARQLGLPVAKLAGPEAKLLSVIASFLADKPYVGLPMKDARLLRAGGPLHATPKKAPEPIRKDAGRRTRPVPAALPGPDPEAAQDN